MRGIPWYRIFKSGVSSCSNVGMLTSRTSAFMNDACVFAIMAASKSVDVADTGVGLNRCAHESCNNACCVILLSPMMASYVVLLKGKVLNVKIACLDLTDFKNSTFNAWRVSVLVTQSYAIGEQTLPPSACRTFLGNWSWLSPKHNYSWREPESSKHECMNLCYTMLGTSASGSVCVLCCAPHVSIRSLLRLYSVHMHAKLSYLLFGGSRDLDRLDRFDGCEAGAT
jgi:hypothetical protein